MGQLTREYFMRRIKVKILGRKPKEYRRIMRFSDDNFWLLGEQKNSGVVGTSMK
jgi:hypothetical protein